MRRQVIHLLVCGLAMWCAVALAPLRGQATAQRSLLDQILSAYLEGDVEVVARTLKRSQEFHETRIADARRLERWLAEWRPAKAAVVLEVADVSTRVAPQYTRFFLDAGRRYLTTAEAAGRLAADDRQFARIWHRAALGMLHRGGNAVVAEAYLDALEAERQVGANGEAADPRLTLARAIAAEQRCWFTRPVLDRADSDVESLMRAARMTVRDPSGPTRAGQATQSERHQTCLQNAVALLKAAAADESTRAEAQIRGGWTLFQLGRAREALEWLERASPSADPDAAYWAALFRGRVLESLRRFDDAAAAYREALGICPAAQSASIGLSLALFRADRIAEADEIARAHRGAASSTPDPWWSYTTADHRFVTQWLTELRGRAR